MPDKAKSHLLQLCIADERVGAHVWTMPEKLNVTAAGELLSSMFAAWPERKKKLIRTWLKNEAVMVNGRVTTKFNHPLKKGDVVTIRSERFAAADTVLASGMRIHFEDASLIVIDKPEGLLSVASEAEESKTAYCQLTAYLRRGNVQSRERVWIVHRLDRETSGLMVFAKTPEAKRLLQENWEKAEKRYQAVVAGEPPEQQGVFDCDLDESNPYKVYPAVRTDKTRHAVTEYRVLKRGKGRALVELKLRTGRRHQIRVHLSHAGCPIVGDPKYGAKEAKGQRLALHACWLRFFHPVTGKQLSFSSPLPREISRLV